MDENVDERQMGKSFWGDDRKAELWCISGLKNGREVMESVVRGAERIGKRGKG